MEIVEIRTTPSLELFSQLVDLLQDAVQSGASVGFLSPLSTAEARNFWMAVLEDVARGERVVLLASENRTVLGCAQLLLTSRINARHRAEVQKLLVHSQHQRRGSGARVAPGDRKDRRAEGALPAARRCPRRRAGRAIVFARGLQQGRARFPRYQRGPDGHFDSTVIFFRNLDARSSEM